MPELERELRALGASVEFPPTPDLAAAVRTRISAATPERRAAWRRPLAISVAALVVAVGAAMAVPGARTAVLEWLGLRGVSIEHVPEQGTLPRDVDLALGDAVSLEEARRKAEFRVRMPRARGLGEPDLVYYSAAFASGGYVSFVYGSPEDVRLLLTQFRARIDEDFLRKLIAPGTTVERTRLGASAAFWIEGAPHEIFYVDDDGSVIPDTARLARNTLLWQDGDVTLRLEGAVTEEEALAIARTVR